MSPVGPVRLAASTLLKELNGSQYAHAGLELLRWDYAAGEPNPSLRARRTAELQLWTGGSPAESAAAPPPPLIHADSGKRPPSGSAASPAALTPPPSPNTGCETVKL